MTALSMPRLLASRATQISNAMLRAMMPTMMTPKKPRQPQATKGLASGLRCQSRKPAGRYRLARSCGFRHQDEEHASVSCGKSGSGQVRPAARDGYARPGEDWPSAADIIKKDLSAQPKDVRRERVSFVIGTANA